MIKKYRIEHALANKQVDYVEVEDGQLKRVVSINGEDMGISPAWTDDIIPCAIEAGIWVELIEEQIH